MSSPIAGGPRIDHPKAADYANRWFVVDEQQVWLSDADLSTIEIDLRHGMLVLKAPGMLRMDIPLDVIEDDESVWMTATVAGQTTDVVDEGDLAAVWFGHVLGRPCRLMKVRPDASVPDFKV